MCGLLETSIQAGLKHGWEGFYQFALSPVDFGQGVLRAPEPSRGAGRLAPGFSESGRKAKMTRSATADSCTEAKAEYHHNN
jgi:hypothetical protein